MKVQSRLGVTIPDNTNHEPVTVNDGDTVNFTASGTDNQTITAEVVIDPAVDNITVATVDGVYTKLIDEVTYAELAALISGSDLIQGRQYLITDYQTVHTIPTTAVTNTGPTEPLIVTALAVNDLEPIAYSTVHKDDIIYYDYVNNSKVKGSTKGCIYRRIDTVNNSDIPFDWREVKFRRWQIDVDTVFDIGATYAVGDVVLDANNTTIWISLINGNIGNTPLDTDGYWRMFEWSNLAYVSYSSVSMSLGSGVSAFTIPVTANYQDIKSFTTPVNARMYYQRIALLDILESNNSYFGSISHSIINVSVDMQSNHIATLTNSNVTSTDFKYNSVLYFYNNDVEADFQNNSINQIADNTILYQFNYNSLRQFYSNHSDTAFLSNKQGSGYSGAFGHNIFNCLFFNNNHVDKTGGEEFYMNEFHKGVSVTGLSFLSATHVFGAYTTQTIARSSGANKLTYVDGTDTVIYAAINA